MDWRRTASVGVAIYDDRIEIENAGMLPEDLPAHKLTYDSDTLASHTSEPPNETIARVMYYSGVIEHWGRGLSMIFEECKRVGLPPPKVTDEMGVVRVTFMRPDLSSHKNDAINDDSRQLSGDAKVKGSERDNLKQMILHYVKDVGPVGAKRNEIFEYLRETLPSRNSDKQNENLVRHILSEMKDSNLIINKGKLWLLKNVQ